MSAPVLSAHSSDGYARARAAVQEAFANGYAILIVGGPPGSFGEKIERRKDITFWPSYERNAHDKVQREIPLGIAVVLVTRLVSMDLSRNVVRAAQARGVPCFTQVHGRSAMIRIVQNEPQEQEQEEQPMPTTPQKPLSAPPRLVTSTPQPVAAPTPAPPRQAGAAQRDAEQLRKLGEEAKAAIDLLVEASVAALARAETDRADAATLHQLRELLKK